MEAEHVIEKILSDARAEAKKIAKQAYDKAVTEQTKLNERLEKYKKETEIIAKKAGEDEKSHILAAARMDFAKQLLAEKRKILDEVFEQARRRLHEMPDDQYRNLCMKLMLEAVETGDEEIVIDKNEGRIGQDLVNQVNQQLSSQNKGNLKLSDERQNLGVGFILRRGKIKTNVSMNVLLEQAHKELEIELARELFQN
jgi:V/A-type H+-transporting ATPase subunit E